MHLYSENEGKFSRYDIPLYPGIIYYEFIRLDRNKHESEKKYYYREECKRKVYGVKEVQPTQTTC